MDNLPAIAKVAAAYFAAVALLVALAFVWHQGHETQAATTTTIVASSDDGEP